MRATSALASLAALFAVVVGVAVFASSRPAKPVPAERKVKLAVLVVFDQMRGDYPARWRPLYGPHGFARLQREGAWFTNCHYPYGVTTTGPGHASMLTGACADTHGIVNNDWYEDDRKKYCAGDPAKYKFVPPAPVFPPDPSDKKPTEPKPVGTPEHLLSETVADVLKEIHGAKTKVFGLSLKDRSAILPTGKRPDGAYWFYGVFGTSTYYSNRVHPWVAKFNESKRADQWFGQNWTKFRPELNYAHWSGTQDDVLGEGRGIAQDRKFPHPMTGGKPTLGPKYYEALANSPFGNEMLLDLAKTCIDAEQLGADDVPDLLVVSFSSNDLIGHSWGPDSHEVLDVTLRSDALIADLLAFLDDRVGKGQYLVGMTADHGICPLPEVSNPNGNANGAARVDVAGLTSRINKHLTAKFPALKMPDGKDAQWTQTPTYFPWFELSSRLIAASKTSRDVIAAEAAKCLIEHPNVLRTFTQAELMGTFPESDVVANRMKRSFNPARCGDVAVVLTPYSLPTPKIGTGTTHGAPFNYDTHVPLLVYGPGIRGGVRTEPTTPQALASIFAKWLNVRRPKDAAFPIPDTLLEMRN